MHARRMTKKLHPARTTNSFQTEKSREYNSLDHGQFLV